MGDARAPGRPLLVLNAGSSTLKFSLFDAAGSGAPRRSARGAVEGIGVHPRLVVADDAPRNADAADHAGAFGVVAEWLDAHLRGARPIAVGHRVVHGGTRYADPVRVDDEVLAGLAALTPLAPLHQPQALAAIRGVRDRWPGVAQVACFDTAFHHGRTELVEAFALPRDLFESGVRRYGFHGLSYEHIAHVLPAVAPEIADGRVIVAHLGNGASLCGMRARRSVETTMSFSALDGLPMGTRVGDLDPAVVLYLIVERGMSPEDVSTLLYTRSGLLGLSGVSSDVRELIASPAPRARFALEFFAYRIAREVGALAGALGGLDGLVFTAGIGERAAPVRADVCARLTWLGVRLDEAANRGHGQRISTADSRVGVFVVPTDEEAVIARHTLGLA
ncbi:MAG TPA: acetate/propionate family kinase [Methylomirabilota bacterium]|nr:acetate/propionate family kinase [Methylomirabilota bacterium]